jgi:kumamolisin
MATTRSGYVPLRGSERPAVAGEKHVGAPDPGRVARLTLLLRRATPLGVLGRVRRRLGREEFTRRYGATDADVQDIRTFAAANGLQIEDVDATRRTVAISGSIGALAQAFDATLVLCDVQGKTYRGQVGPVHLPSALDGVVLGVFGLDERPVSAPHFRMAAKPAAEVGSFAVGQLAGFYQFPQLFNGEGQTIAIIEFGGGFITSDLDTYFSGVGLATPYVEPLSIDGATNSPIGDPDSADGEVMLDIEVAGSIAPGASILVYFASNDDQGWIDAITTAIHAAPGIVSISWGGPESNWSPATMTAIDNAFQDAALLGVTVCVASGDNGSTDGLGDSHQHVDFPASSPHVLACGGTRLDSPDGTTIADEVVWNDAEGATGGGVSDIFPLPPWQAEAGVPPSPNPGSFAGRGVPDVAGDADPETGYAIRVDGKNLVFGGTSAVAPLWAGLVALMNQCLGLDTVGFLNPVLYEDASAQATFRDITDGNNGNFSAVTGWDPCTGWGSPHGGDLLDVLGTWAFAQVQIQFD